MAWPGRPQKLQVLPSGTLIPDAVTPVLRSLALACWDWMATLNILLALGTMAVSASILTTLVLGGQQFAGTGLVACCSGRSARDIEAAPVSTQLTASYMSAEVIRVGREMVNEFLLEVLPNPIASS